MQQQSDSVMSHIINERSVPHEPARRPQFPVVFAIAAMAFVQIVTILILVIDNH